MAKISKLFAQPRSYAVLYDLGGSHSNKVHNRYITEPIVKSGIDGRETNSEAYYTDLIGGIEQDSAETCADPSFHALVIHSNYKNPVFAPTGSIPDA